MSPPAGRQPVGNRLIAVVALVALGVLGLAVTEKIKLISEAIVA